MAGARTVFFIGKPGCGKGTQAKLLSEHTGWSVISAGAQFRDFSKKDSFVGRKVKQEIDSGLLAPHWFAMYLFQKALFSISENESVVFDGFNRKPEEARLVIDAIKWIGRSFTVINISISDELVRERINTRRGVESRGDDNSVETRLEEYYKYTLPSLEMFRSASELVEIDGSKSVIDVTSDIIKALNI